MSWKNARLAVFGLSAVMATGLAWAGPHDDVSGAVVEEGEKEIDLKWGTQKERDGSRTTAASIGLGWGVNSWWFTELYASYQRDGERATRLESWEWENRFQLTETGKYPVDVGFLLEIERPADHVEGYEVTYGPLFQTDWGEVQGNLNVLIQRHVRAGESFNTELLYQAQVKYRHSAQLEWGVQALGNVGQWDHWAVHAQQEHKIGPALFGKVKLGSHQSVNWNAAVLRGLTDATPRTTVRVQTELEF